MKKNLVDYVQEIREDRLRRGLDPCGIEDIVPKRNPSQGLKRVKNKVQRKRQKTASALYGNMFPKEGRRDEKESCGISTTK